MSTEESFMDQQTQMVGGIFDDQAETQAADRSPVKQVVKTPVQYHFELASPGFGPQNENKQRVNDHTLNTDKDATKVKSHHGTLIPESTKSVEQIDDCSVDTNARALAAQNSSCGNETSLIAYISSARKVCDDDDDSSVESEVLIGVRPPSGAPVGWAESSTPSAIPASERTSPACLSSLTPHDV